MPDKIYLGKVKKEIPFTQPYKSVHNISILGEPLYFEEHSWDCGWYWGFGYIGNKNLHTHASVFAEKLIWNHANDVFENTDTSVGAIYNDKVFWVFKDLLRQAYDLRKAAEVYRHGGFCTSLKGVTDIIKNKEKEEMINADLEIVLDKLWESLLQWQSEKLKLVKAKALDSSRL